MTKSRLNEIHYNRFFEVMEDTKNKVWTAKSLAEKINWMIPSNIHITKTGLRVLIAKQQRFHVFKCARIYNAKTTTYYLFKKCLPIEN